MPPHLLLLVIRQGIRCLSNSGGKYTDRTRYLGGRNDATKPQVATRDTQIAEAGKEMESSLSTLQHTLTAVQEEKDEARQEVETLRQYMYSSRNKKNHSDNNNRYKPVTAILVNQVVNYGRSANEESSSSSTTQVAPLRTENTRLREDAKAKDNWMQMAVERLKGMAGENESPHWSRHHRQAARRWMHS
jgi:hypothetical protein